MATDNFVAAIEIGSSKITGMLGRRMPDGSMQVVAYCREKASAFIRRGKINNLEQAGKCLERVRTHLEDAVKQKIAKVYVAFDGQGLHSVGHSVVREFDVDTEIGQELIDGLLEEDRQQELPGYKLMDVVPTEYILGKDSISPSALQPGFVANRIEGRFLNIYYKADFLARIKESLFRAGFANVEYRLTPLVLGEGIVSEDAKRTGCVLVDFGKDTTSVSVYTSKLLRRLAVIPLGAGNITKDIASILNIEEQDAENLKTEYGVAFSEKPPEDDEDPTYSLPGGGEVKASKLNDIVEARIEEILKNVEEQITRSDIKTGEDLIGGAIITGGGASQKGIERAFKQFVKFGLDVKTVKSPSFQVNSKFKDARLANGTLTGILSLLSQCDEDSSGGELVAPGLLDYEETRYAVSDSAESAPALNNSQREPEGWQKLMPVEKDTKYVWETKAKISGTGAGSLVGCWSEPVCINKNDVHVVEEKKKPKKDGRWKNAKHRVQDFINKIVGPETEDAEP